MIFLDISNSLLEELFLNNKNFEATIDRYTKINVVLALSLAGIPFLVSTIYHYLASTLYQKPFPLPKFIHSITIVLCIALYKPLMALPTYFLKILDKATYELTNNQYEDRLLKFYDTITGEISTELPDQQQSRNAEQQEQGGIYGAFKSLLNASFSGLLKILTKIIRGVSIAVSLLLAKLFYVLMPLCLMFSIFPGYEKGFERCFDNYIACHVNLVVLNILDAIMTSMALLNLKDTSADQTCSNMIINTVITTMYCLSFWVTSRLIGKSEGSGKILSTAVSMATSGVAISRKIPEMRDKLKNMASNLKKGITSTDDPLAAGMKDMIKK